MASFINNIGIAHPGSRNSILMKYMSQYKILQVRYWYSKHNLQRSPILLEFPTFLRYVSVYYLAFSAVSINKRNIIEDTAHLE